MRGISYFQILQIRLSLGSEFSKESERASERERPKFAASASIANLDTHHTLTHILIFAGSSREPLNERAA